MSSCKVWRNVCAAAAAVSPHVACLAVLFLYLGAAVWRAPPDAEGPPSSATVRLIFMLAVALLVAGRKTEPNSLTGLEPNYGASGFLCKVIMTILICNLALSLLWDPLERGVFALVVPMDALISRTVGVDLGADNLQLIVTSLLAAIFLIWVIVSVVSINRIIKKVRRILCLDQWSVRFLKMVEVRRIIPRSHATEKVPSEPIHAPSGGQRNPLVDPPGNALCVAD